MKKVFLVFALASIVFFVGCEQNNPKGTESNIEVEEQQDLEESEELLVDAEMASEEDTVHFGKIIESEGAISIDDFASRMTGEDTLRVKIEAIATEICQKKGCWMKVETAEGKSIRIRFKDYAFFVPKDIAGRSVVFEGIAFKDTISVADLRHYAEDEGKSEEEIAAITEAEIKTSFIANGVLIR